MNCCAVSISVYMCAMFFGRVAISNDMNDESLLARSRFGWVALFKVMTTVGLSALSDSYSYVVVAKVFDGLLVCADEKV